MARYFHRVAQMVVILDISLDTAVKEQLLALRESVGADLELHHADTTQRALDHINDLDIDVILVDVRVLPKLRREINELLAGTTLTTRIFLLEPPDEVVDLEPFSHLGLKTITLPLSPDKLQQVLC